jgi:Domain of unknown function (DUF1841)
MRHRTVLRLLMFNPSQPDVRRFFCDTYEKHLQSQLLTPMQAIAAQWIALHPEYHAELGDVQAALAADYNAALGKDNPFLHLSMHLTLTEQVSIDQPRGIKQAYALLAAKHDEHEAHHLMMQCLGEMVWQSQRTQQPPDGETYIECVRRMALK